MDSVGATSRLRATVLERLKSGNIHLPLLPQVASQVVMLAADPRVDAARLSGLIHKDPSLAGHVLQIANSPGYMPRMPIVSLQQAVARLGLSAVTEIAFVASLQSGTFKVPGYEKELGALWRHAIASAAFAKEIARLKRANVESAFLCGLLHAIGKPALLQVVADVELELDRHLGTKGTLRVAVPAVLAEFHVQIGGQISALWHLPLQVASAIAHQADYGQAPAFKQEAMITHLADELATDLIEPPGFRADELRHLRVIADLNLYPIDFEELLSKRAAITALVESMTT
jgi:HD-like signal output (HDOD) protein